jgi:hypothetical protein
VEVFERPASRRRAQLGDGHGASIVPFVAALFYAPLSDTSQRPAR